MERTFRPADYLSILKRRRIWFIVPFAAIVLLGLALAVLLPATYRSSATIAVQAPAVSPSLVPAPAALDNEERLRALSQQLFSRAVLERVIRDEGLAGDQPMEEVVRLLRAGVSVEVPKPIAKTDRPQQLNTFDIVYRDSTAEGTQKIANRLAQAFVDEHTRSREAQAEGTVVFLNGELRNSQQKIADLEQRLRAAKEVNMGKLPEQTLANLQTLAGMRQQLEATSNSLRGEQDRLSLIERNIQAVRQGMYAVGSTAGAPVASSPQTRILALQRELAAARGKYTEKHPEIQHLESEIETARAEIAAAKNQPAGREDALSADPGYQQLEAERNLVQLRIRAMRRAESQLQSDIGRYQQRVEAAPMVEQQLASLQREYDLEKENYKALSAKHGAAVVQEQIERGRGGERFSVLYGAYLPDSPESPKRGRILLIALALALALGAGAALGREFLDSSVHDARMLQSEFDVPVLAEIPRIGRPVAQR
jgi:polysaccharide chain length determinant protein (PEP-CTERM system associated)